MCIRARAAEVFLIVAVSAVPFVPVASQDTIVKGPDSVEVTIAGKTLTVPAFDDSVTVVLYVDIETPQPVTLWAHYRGEARYRATDALGVPPGDVGVRLIPWHPWPVTIGRSREIELAGGDVVLIRYPTDYGPGGWLSRTAS